MTRILLDARKARDFGIGAYVLGLIGGLARRGGFELAAVVRPEDANLFPAGVTRIVSDALNYSLGELMSVRNAIGLAKPDIFHAPHYVVPAQGLTRRELLALLSDSRSKLRQAISEADGVDLSLMHFPHPVLGRIDMYQWILYLGKHERRHIAQIARSRGP